MRAIEWARRDCYAWIKSSKGKYLKVSEGFAILAGQNKAEAIRGKTDDNLIWRADSEYIQEHDGQIFELGATQACHHLIPTLYGPRTYQTYKWTHAKLLYGIAIDITPIKFQPIDAQRAIYKFTRLEFSQKEIQFIRHLLLGHCTKQMMKTMKCSERTVRNYRQRIRTILGVPANHQIVQALHELKLGYLAISDSPDAYLNR